MNTNSNIVETRLTPEELVRRLRSITITDFAQLQTTPHATYYGEVKPDSFSIMNVQYGPMSSFPPIQGRIKEGRDRTTIEVTVDIKSQFRLARSMYYGTLIPIGLIVMQLSILVLGGTEYQTHGYIFSAAFLACALLAVLLTKTSLVSTKGKELSKFASNVEGWIVTEESKRVQRNSGLRAARGAADAA